MGTLPFVLLLEVSIIPDSITQISVLNKVLVPASKRDLVEDEWTPRVFLNN